MFLKLIMYYVFNNRMHFKRQTYITLGVEMTHATQNKIK